MKNGLILILSVFILSACGEKSDVPAKPQETMPMQPQAAAQQQANGKSSPVQLSGADLFTVACQACHSLAPDAPNRLGPNLYGVVGRAAASHEGFTYSEALQQSGITWDKANLMAWVVAPESLVPGTWMLYHSVLAGDELPRLIEYIEQEANPTQP